MFIHGVDRGEEEEWRAFLAAHPFGELVAGGGPARRVPVVVPTQYVIDGDDVLVHLLARNPVWEAIAEQPGGPAGGVGRLGVRAVELEGARRRGSASRDPHHLLRVGAAHRHGDDGGRPRRRRGVAAYAAGVRSSRTRTWSIRPSTTPGCARSAALRLRVEDVRAKFKYGGNVDPAHREAVLTRLRDRDAPGDRAAAAHLARRIDR